MRVRQVQIHLDHQDTVTVTHGNSKGSYWVDITAHAIDPTMLNPAPFQMTLFCRDPQHQADVLEAITNTSFNAFIRVPVEQKNAQATVLVVPSMVQEREPEDTLRAFVSNNYGPDCP